jgi:NAD(P)-dependent dehydrogenase (short-subunit alcohol dehydrogenase family)
MREGPLRAIVVGASSGLGRGIGVGLAKRGAEVVLMARRQDLLAQAAEEADGRAYPITCDVTDGASCQTAIAEAVEKLGAVDGVVYCPGVGVLRRIEELTVADWRKTFDTNVVGASIFTAAALPYLTDANGTAVFLSSVSASFTPPWPGLAAYSVTKAAMDKLVEAWRSEHPHVGFTRIVVGDCAGGEGAATSQFMADFDMDLLTELFPTWMNRALLAGTVFESDELVHMVDSVLRCGASAAIPTLTLIPRQGSTATSIAEFADRGIPSISEQVDS